MLDYTQLLISYGLPLLFPLVIGSMGTCVLLSAKKARFVPHFLLGVYVCCLCYVTLCRASVYDSSVHFQVFSAWQLAWNTFSFQNWANLLLNVALLWPFGILFPLVFQKIKKWTVAAGLVLSLLIESLQLLTHRGIFDVDDLLCNTVGCAMGFGLLYFCQNIRRSPRRAWAGAVPALLPLLFFGGAMGYYALKPLGNLALPETPARLENVTWVLETDLPAISSPVQICQLGSLTTAQCDALADQIAAAAGITFDSRSHYNLTSEYTDHAAHGLFIERETGTFLYEVTGDIPTEWAPIDQDRLAEILKKYGVPLPKNAVLTPEGDGWYSYRSGNASLRVRCSENGTVYAIENRLSSRTPIGTADLRSPQDAYAALCDGDFYSKYQLSGEVRVTDCKLEEMQDTKGILQSVYRFHLVTKSREFDVLIPAIQTFHH